MGSRLESGIFRAGSRLWLGLCVAALLAFASNLVAAEDEGVKDNFAAGTAARAAGQGCLGCGFKKAGRAVGSAVREIGKGAKEAGKAVGQAAKEGGKEFKRAVKGER
jgi:hypothetical protein